MYFGLSELEVAAVVSGKGNINKNNISMDDIEKRKSFADMKLVDFTSGSGNIEVIKIVSWAFSTATFNLANVEKYFFKANNFKILQKFNFLISNVQGIPGLEEDCNGHAETEDSEDSKSKVFSKKNI